jgi:cytochrome c oxidase cbb3-type subunit 1
MVIGHLVFAAHFMLMVTNVGPQRDQPALFRHLFARKATP